MTREIAIDILDDNFTVIDTHGHYTDEEVEQARQMAIKALEEQQNPNSIRINFVGEEEAEEFKEYLKNQQQCIIAQESILDKIRDEIGNITDTVEINPQSVWNGKRYVRYAEVLNIIDKYKAESEVEE